MIDKRISSNADILESRPSRLRQRRRAIGRGCLRQFPDHTLSFDGQVVIPSEDNNPDLLLISKSNLSFEGRRNAVTDIVTSYEGDPRVESIVDSFRTGIKTEHNIDLKEAIENTVSSFQPLDYKKEQLPLFWNIEHGLELYEKLGHDLSDLSEAQEDVMLKLTASRQVLHLTNMRLVLKAAKKFRNIGDLMPYADILQEGNLGLMRAISLFDASRNNTFSTYACKAVESKILIAIAEQSRNIRLPVQQDSNYLKIKRVRDQIEELGRSADISELAEITGIPEDEITLLIRTGDPQYMSIDSPIGPRDSSVSISELVYDSAGDIPVDMIADSDVVLRIISQSSLGPREKAVIGLRYRLDPKYFKDHVFSGGTLSPTDYSDVFECVGIDPKYDLAKHTSIAGLFGYCRQWSQQVEKDALSVLRSEAKIKGIDKLYFEDSSDELSVA